MGQRNLKYGIDFMPSWMRINPLQARKLKIFAFIAWHLVWFPSSLSYKADPSPVKALMLVEMVGVIQNVC